VTWPEKLRQAAIWYEIVQELVAVAITSDKTTPKLQELLDEIDVGADIQDDLYRLADILEAQEEEKKARVSSWIVIYPVMMIWVIQIKQVVFYGSRGVMNEILFRIIIISLVYLIIGLFVVKAYFIIKPAVWEDIYVPPAPFASGIRLFALVLVWPGGVVWGIFWLLREFLKPKKYR
jgi:hypothetical protein